MIVILTFLTGLGLAGKVSKYNVQSTDKAALNFGILTTKVEGGTRSLTGTNNRSIRDSKILAGKMDLNIGKRLNSFELMLLVGDLAAKNSGLLYILLLNNGVIIFSLFIAYHLSLRVVTAYIRRISIVLSFVL